MKLTNSDTSTATDTVTPNSRKNLPTIPCMNASGMNTATMESDVARTANPISAVPCRDASIWDFPMCRWRVMFSRTTMASSMMIPMDRISASIVIVFSVNPSSAITASVPRMEMGSVNPVMTVERQELRNRNTIAVARSPPSIRVA